MTLSIVLATSLFGCGDANEEAARPARSDSITKLAPLPVKRDMLGTPGQEPAPMESDSEGPDPTTLGAAAPKSAPRPAPADYTDSGSSGDATGGGGLVFYKRVIVLSIGIDHYKSLQAAEFAQNDAEDFSSVLRERYGYTTVNLLGEHATKKAILDNVRQCAGEEKVSGTVCKHETIKQRLSR